MATSPKGKDMAGGGWGGPVVFPHPDDDNTGRLLGAVQRTVHICCDETRLVVFSVPLPLKKVLNVFLPETIRQE